MNNHTLKVRDRTTGKLREALVDAEDYARLSQYTYLTDKNSDEPFREHVTSEGKRPRIALKRDVMGFQLGDPRRVCYVDKSNIFDCRKTNLKVKTEIKPMVKIVKTVDASIKETKTNEILTSQESVDLKLPLNNEMEIKRALSIQLDPDEVLEMVSVDRLLGAWAKRHGYEKKHA